MNKLLINDAALSIDLLECIFKSGQPIELSEPVQAKVSQSYKYLHTKIQSSDALIYGVNTGFGSLCNVQIPAQDLQNLQHNLLKSHACGVGAIIDPQIAKLILLLKIKNISLAYSGVNPLVLGRLVYFYNHNLTPLIYEQGSLGASGDLAPLAHLSLPLIGLGQLRKDTEYLPTDQILAEHNLQPLALSAKEGLALLNGTQFCLAYGITGIWEAMRLSRLADFVAALSADVFLCHSSPYDARLHTIRPHAGQIATAKTILYYLKDTPLSLYPRPNVQDPYSFRCVPQVHGASKDALSYLYNVLETELNSVTDNPTIFEESDAILSGGNFHAQPLALAMDFGSMAIAELGNISERRLYQLISGQRGLPPFLTQNAGLSSGMMIVQYTAASLVNKNKQLCAPVCVDSIVSCNGQEDHVSMGANAGVKWLQVVKNTEILLAMEFMAAAQALSLRAAESFPIANKIMQAYRQVVPMLKEDRVLSTDIQATVNFLRPIHF